MKATNQALTDRLEEIYRYLKHHDKDGENALTTLQKPVLKTFWVAPNSFFK